MDGDNGDPRIAYALEHLFSFTARVEAPQFFGPTPEGLRTFFPVVEGRLWGPRLSGTVIAGSGGDWMTVRRDGVQVLDVRATVRTDDGALIHAEYQGLADAGADGYENYLNGRPPGRLAVRASARYRSGHPKYHWLNRLQCINVGEADVENLRLRYDVYALR